MPSQRQTDVKPLLLNVVAGINERETETELPPPQYSFLSGTFPEFAGLQSRLWGKRTLAKYPDSIYGIHQFWTPQGYGGGLYQFNDQLDFGAWITPLNTIDLAVPAIGYDGGGMTLNEFGYSYGSNFGYNDDNVCAISFGADSSTHGSCLPPATVVDTPNDSNGGPAGQGKRCQWVVSSVDITASIGTYIIAGQQGDSGASDVSIGTGLPLPLPLPAAPPIPYLPLLTGPYAFLLLASYAVGADDRNSTHAIGTKTTFDFTALQVQEGFISVTAQMLRQVLTVGMTGNSDVIEITLPITGEILGIDYLHLDNSTRTTSDGHDQTLQSYALSFAAHYRKRVCS